MPAALRLRTPVPKRKEISQGIEMRKKVPGHPHDHEGQREVAEAKVEQRHVHR